MFKGTTTIELTDVYSGATETHTDTNMVTNALKEIYTPLGFAQDTALMYGHLSDTSNLLGGLLMFDTSLDASPDNLYAPSTANLVGCGVYNKQNTTTGTQRGHYNVSESVINPEEGYVKYVWDFQTAQGNGTIHSVCLTSASGGYCSYGGEDTTRSYNGGMYTVSSGSTLKYIAAPYTGGNTAGKNTITCVLGVTEFLFAFDLENDVALYFRIDSTSAITIVKRRAWFKNVSVFYNPVSEKPVWEEIQVQLNVPLSTTSNVTYNFDKENSTLSIFTSSSIIQSSGSTFDMVHIDINTATSTTYSVTNTTGETIYTTGAVLACHRGFILVRGYTSPYNLYRIKIGSWLDVEKIELKGEFTLNLSSKIINIHNGIIYYGYGATQQVAVNIDTATATQTEHCYSAGIVSSTSTVTIYYHYPIIGSEMMYECDASSTSEAGYFVMPSHYLATINNLSEPVTKTDDKTMKVTYVIQSSN